MFVLSLSMLLAVLVPFQSHGFTFFNPYLIKAKPLLSFDAISKHAFSSKWRGTASSSLQRSGSILRAESVGETHQFKAEVSRVMDIIIHSLYQDKDVFLRELVSNAADACDKQRFELLTNGKASTSDELKIRVKGDMMNNTLSIQDNGVGMTKDELMNNLGKIAQSGSKRFMEALKDSKSNDQSVNLIGQFGVGFYSGYLVADKITVLSTSEKDPHTTWIWESSAGNSYTIRSEPVSETMKGKSGTSIVLQLKEEYDEYAGEYKLRDMLKKYSSFVTFPIELWSEKTEYKPSNEQNASATDDDAMKSVTTKSFQWERINMQQPIWMRSPKEVNQSEYTEFYKSTFKAYDEPTTLTHFALEGQVDFKALLFVPSVVPYELTKDMFSEQSKSMKLFVKRVFINDKFDELMPRWLTFVRGIVDSEDLPLNVGREILQKSKMLSVINKRLVRKSIDMFNDIAKKGHEQYDKFWTLFGKYIKVGMIEDDVHKDELAKLYRTWTSKSGDGQISLPDYVDRMQPNQTKIFYVTGDGKEVAARSPVLEKLKDQNIEVIYLSEPLDELAFQSISNFEGKLLVDAAKGDQDSEGEGSDAKKKKEHQKELSMLCDWLKDKLGGNGELSKVDVSTRLTSSPAALVQGAYGMSPTMQRYMKAQAAAAGEQGMSRRMENLNKVTLELNPKHPIVLKLNEMVQKDPSAEDTLNYATLLYEVASLASGYQLPDPSSFAARVNAIMESITTDSTTTSESSPTAEKPVNVEAEVVN